jgi:effector-binding domain-containing protein
MKYFLFSATAILAMNSFIISPIHICSFINRENSDYILPDTVKIELQKTSFNDMPVLFIKDTAVSTEKMKDVFGKDYGELMQFITNNKLQPLKFMAWYRSVKAPWFVDVAVQTDRVPNELSGRIQSRIQKGGEVLIAHMWGPYDQVGQAYAKIENWLKENNRKAKGNPFEVYINDPSSVKSPSEIQTDVYQPIE